MKTIFRSALMLVPLCATPGWAHTTAEPVNVTCKVLDANGAELAPDEQARGRDFEGMRALNGASARFLFDVYLKDGEGRFVLLDKSNGEKVMVQQSHFASGETVTVSLVSEDSEEARLTLTCVGV